MTSIGGGLSVRVAAPSDAEAVGALLRAAYGALLAPSCEAGLPAEAVPLMVQPNPALLSCGTWYVAELRNGGLVGCGGWTLAPPGQGSGAVDPALGHLRHFATHPGHARRGVGRAVFARCASAARAAGVEAFACQATLAAELFYRALGFETLGRGTAMLGGWLAVPVIHMRIRLAEERRAS